MRFQWKGATPAAKTMLGDPSLGPLEMCVYDGDGEVLNQTTFTSGAAWSESSRAFRFRGRRLPGSGFAPVKADVVGGDRPKVRASTGGSEIAIEQAPFQTPVTVRILGQDGVSCVEASFDSNVQVNSQGRFRARSD